MAIKGQIPKHSVNNNIFNKDRFKGNKEVIEDFDLDITLYVYEPQTLAELPDDASDEDRNKIINKTTKGGEIITNLVPFKEAPEIKVNILSKSGNIDMIEWDDALSVYTNKQLAQRLTKRYYSFEKLPIGVKAKIETDLWTENNYTEVINNDNTFKQTTFTIEKVLEYEVSSESLVYKREFWVNNPISKDVKYVQIEFDTPTLLGQVETFGVTENIINKSTFKPNNDSNYIITDEGSVTTKPGLHPHFVAPVVSDEIVLWQVPWTWEWQFMKAQWEGTFKWWWDSESGAADVNDGRPTQLAGKQYDITSDDYYNRDESDIIYRQLYDSSVLASDGGVDEMNFFLPYGTTNTLPNEISSHGMGYLETSSNDEGGGLLSGIIGGTGIKYTDNSYNGARATEAQGNWRSRSRIFAFDYAYWGFGVLIGDEMRLYMTEIDLGAFYNSIRYFELSEQVIDGIAEYNGVLFNSNLGILSNISDERIGNDIAKQSIDGNSMMLFPYRPDELGGGSDWKKENLLNKLPVESPASPKFKGGLTDFKPATLVTNNPAGFVGSHIEPTFLTTPSEDVKRTRICFELDGLETVGEIAMSYFGSNTYTIKKFSAARQLLETTEYKSNLAQGYNISGGMRHIWL